MHVASLPSFLAWRAGQWFVVAIAVGLLAGLLLLLMGSGGLLPMEPGRAMADASGDMPFRWS